MPRDVAPQPGEWNETLDASDPCRVTTDRVVNPRDGLNTIVVHTQGEEGFVDDNGNGQYDEGERFYDLGEPFVDVDDNNVRDPDEEFVDVNGDGAYNGPNGVWDANTTIWASNKVMFTGLPVTAEWTISGGSFTAIPFESSQVVGVTFADENGNEPSAAFSTFDLEVETSNVGASFARTFISRRTDRLGSAFLSQVTNCDANRVCSLRSVVTTGLPRAVSDYLSIGRPGPDQDFHSSLLSSSVEIDVGEESKVTVHTLQVASGP
jgi:hypothetical protein